MTTKHICKDCNHCLDDDWFPQCWHPKIVRLKHNYVTGKSWRVAGLCVEVRSAPTCEHFEPCPAPEKKPSFWSRLFGGSR